MIADGCINIAGISVLESDRLPDGIKAIVLDRQALAESQQGSVNVEISRNLLSREDTLIASRKTQHVILDPDGIIVIK